MLRKKRQQVAQEAQETELLEDFDKHGTTMSKTASKQASKRGDSRAPSLSPEGQGGSPSPRFDEGFLREDECKSLSPAARVIV